MDRLGTGDGVRLSLINTKYLHANSTSHEWMFGALAEIIDNACDPDVMANQFWIDVKFYDGQQCLVLTDNGLGMDTDTLHRMLSFGFSDKPEVNGHLPIGRYGNGFKSGSMRLGKDALVFTYRSKTSMSVGMLSQTYLDKINSETVVVPIVTWNEDEEIVYPESGNRTSLDAILKHSIFHSQKELIDQIYSIPHNRQKKFQGTRIVIYNLARDDQSVLELDFNTDLNDILIPTERLEGTRLSENNPGSKRQSVSLYRQSLRKYLSILYLRHRMQIFLRGKKVQLVVLTKLLKNRKLSVYKPKSIISQQIKIEFGLNPDRDEYGIVIYYRNRLIQAFRKFNYQKRDLPSGIEYQKLRQILDQVIGVVELNCITPNHIKQGFQDDTKFRNVEHQLMSRLWDYSVSHVCEMEEQRRSGTLSEDGEDLWVQCDNPECQKWRRLPFALGINNETLPSQWYCDMNPDTTHNSCTDPEEPEDEPDQVQKTPGAKSRRTSMAANENVHVQTIGNVKSETTKAPEGRTIESPPKNPAAQPIIEPTPAPTMIPAPITIPTPIMIPIPTTTPTATTPAPTLTRSASFENVLRQIQLEQDQVENNRKRRNLKENISANTPTPRTVRNGNKHSVPCNENFHDTKRRCLPNDPARIWGDYEATTLGNVNDSPNLEPRSIVPQSSVLRVRPSFPDEVNNLPTQLQVHTHSNAVAVRPGNSNAVAVRPANSNAVAVPPANSNAVAVPIAIEGVQVKTEPEEDPAVEIKKLRRKVHNFDKLLMHRDSRISLLERQLNDLRQTYGLAEPTSAVRRQPDSQDSDIIVIDEEPVNCNDGDADKMGRIELLLRQYLTRIWGAYQPHPDGIEKDLELLVRQAASV